MKQKSVIWIKESRFRSSCSRRGRLTSRHSRMGSLLAPARATPGGTTKGLGGGGGSAAEPGWGFDRLTSSQILRILQTIHSTVEYVPVLATHDLASGTASRQ